VLVLKLGRLKEMNKNESILENFEKFEKFENFEKFESFKKF